MTKRHEEEAVPQPSNPKPGHRSFEEVPLDELHEELALRAARNRDLHRRWRFGRSRHLRVDEGMEEKD